MLISHNIALAKHLGKMPVHVTTSHSASLSFIEAHLGTKDVYIVKCFIKSQPKRYPHHSLIVRQDCNQDLGKHTQLIDWSNINTIIRDVDIVDHIIQGPALCGPTKRFKHLMLPEGGLI